MKPKWWNKPVTWGDSFKAAGVGMLISAIMWGVMVGIGEIESRRDAKRTKEWREALLQEEKRMQEKKGE